MKMLNLFWLGALQLIVMEFYDISVDTISLDDLIKAKEATGRTKDKLHLLELNAIKDIKKK